MNKRGFTLIELLVTIALLSVLVVFAVPSIYKFLTEGYNKAIALQVTKVEEAAGLFLEDYCKMPISSAYQCPNTSPNILTYNQTDGYSGKICLNTLQNTSDQYIGTISFRKNTCTGYIVFENDNPKAYLKCGEYVSEGYDTTKATGC